jgi:hypothetical protein
MPGAPKHNENRREHGVYAVRDRGTSALSPEIRYREHEIVKNLGTGDGALMELERVGLYYMLILEQAAHYLRGLAEQGENPWTAGKDGKPIPLLNRLGTYLAGAQRTLAQLAKLRGDRDVLDLAAGMADVQRQLRESKDDESD